MSAPPTPTFLTLVINLDRSPERLQVIGKSLTHLGIPWSRLPAAEGKHFDLNDPALVNQSEFFSRHGKAPTHGELGCYLSHVWAMKRFLESTAQFCLVLEDDSELADSLPLVLGALQETAQHWDMVKLSGVHRGSPLAIVRLDKERVLSVTATNYTGSSAYMVNRKAAQAYADALLPMCVPYDHEFDRAWRWGIKVRAVFPAPCGHVQDNVSTIATAIRPTKPHWIKRLSAMRWRLVNQSTRLAYAFGVWVRSKA